MDVILSDLDFTREEDDVHFNQYQMMQLNNLTMYVALKTLKIGGTVLLKSLKGQQKEKNERYLKLFFQDFTEIKHNLIESFDYDEVFYLGKGFKLNPTLDHYKKFIEAMIKGDLDGLSDQDIPPEFMTIEEIDRERFKILAKLSETQFPIPKKWVTQLRSNTRYQGVDWDKYDLNVQQEDLTEEQEDQFLRLMSQTKKKYEDIDEAIADSEKFLEKWKLYRSKRQIKKDSALLEEGETLGDDSEYQEMKQLEDELKRIGAVDDIDDLFTDGRNYELEKELEMAKEMEKDPNFVKNYNEAIIAGISP